MKELIKLPPFAQNVIERLEGAGFDAYAVGGCVRNPLMNLDCSDCDITTSALPEETKKIFSDIKVVETGIKHGTVTVILGTDQAEITTFRTEGRYKDFRHPDNVTFTDKISEDLARRDFTVNAVAYSPSKGIVDLYGGEEDLKNNVLRCVGDPEKRFEEDALRIMRGLRFMAVYGFNPEKETDAAFHTQKELLREISPERINSELCKLICGTPQYLERVLLDYYDVFAVLIPEIAACHGFLQHTHYHNKDVWAHTVSAVCSIEPVDYLRLTMLIHDLGKPSSYQFYNGEGHFKGHAAVSAEICKRVISDLRFDGETAKKVLFLVERHDMAIKDDPVLIKKHLNKFGIDLYMDLIKVHIADDMAKAEIAQNRISGYNAAAETARQIIAEKDCFSLKNLALNGNDIKEMGYQGREIGKALDLLLDAVIEEKCVNSSEELRSYLGKNKVE